MRRQHDRRALVGEAADELPEVATSLRVEAGRRLVEEEQFWPADDAQADVDAPLLAAGEAGNPGVGLLIEANGVNHLVKVAGL